MLISGTSGEKLDVRRRDARDTSHNRRLTNEWATWGDASAPMMPALQPRTNTRAGRVAVRGPNGLAHQFKSAKGYHGHRKWPNSVKICWLTRYRDMSIICSKHAREIANVHIFHRTHGRHMRRYQRTPLDMATSEAVLQSSGAVCLCESRWKHAERYHIWA